MHPPLYDLSPLLQLLLLGALLACGPLLLVAWRHRHASASGRIYALTAITLFLTFDLVLFGAFTRLTDSGLGCPDWPGCYGSASPLGADPHITAAQQAMPTGPVTQSKAWIEMVHRYLATGVGALITVLLALRWFGRSKDASISSVHLGWPVFTLVWVCVQGAFGALTVTMKLFPAIVSLHLLGGYVLLALLTVQWAQWSQILTGHSRVALLRSVRWWVAAALALLLLQAASGAWVSTNYAVLACTEFPACQGSWWPPMDFNQGFALWRKLGLNPDGTHISFQALTAIHYAHRMLAVITLVTLGSLAAYLWRFLGLGGAAKALGSLLVLQVITGVSNAVLDWPLLAAVLHTGGAGAMVVVLTWLLSSTQSQTRSERAHAFSGRLTE
jgi:cytochrome c oxidase assembly protein subunit 15